MTRRKETARREPALRHQQPAQRPGRPRPVRRVRRPFRRRDADAADPGGRAGLSGGARRSGVPDGAGRLPEELCRPAQRAVVRRAADPAPRRREGLLQARRAEPHRQPQGQQLHGPDPAGQADGQDADHRRDRRRPARRGDRDDVRAVRAAVHRLHGRHRRRAAGAQRVPHEAAGRGGEAGDLGRLHAEGRDERGAARLGRQCRGHLLPDRHRRRARIRIR